MSRYVQRKFYWTTSGLTAFLLLILLSFSFVVNSEDPFLPGGGDVPDTGDVGPVGSVDNGSTVTDSSILIPLKNASFEQGSDTPLGWTPLHLPPDQYLWDGAVASLGSRSLSILGTRYFYGRWESEAVDVSKGGYNWYSLSSDVKTASNDGEVYLCLAWFNTQGEMIATSDSQMVSFGDNDWHSVEVNALPPEDAKTFSVWCISNHNSGVAWFDNIKLKLTQFQAQGKVSYDQFLVEYPTSVFVISALTMPVRSLMTEAKWIRESGFYDPGEQLKASKLYAEAAGIVLNESVLKRVTTSSDGDFNAEKNRFEALIDEALWEAAKAANNGDAPAEAQSYLSEIAKRRGVGSIGSVLETLTEEFDTEGGVTD